MMSGVRGLWLHVINAKYGGWKELGSQRLLQKQSIWWKHLGKVCGINGVVDWFNSNMKWKVGDESRAGLRPKQPKQGL